jgi:hypothetical protein
LEIVAFVKEIKAIRIIGHAGDMKPGKSVDEDIKLYVLLAEEAFCNFILLELNCINERGNLFKAE